MNQHVMRVWFSDDGNYKIVWSRECMGVSINPHFHALVREYANSENKVWNFAGRRGPYRKLNTAIAACAYHEKVWRAMIQIAQGEFKGRAERIRSLDGRARVGTAPFRGRVFAGLPVWVRHEAADAYRIINGTIFGKPCKTADDNDPFDQPGALTTSESSSPETQDSATAQETTPTPATGGPASSALVAGEFETPPTETPSKDTSSRRGTSAKRAKAKAAPTKKPSKRSTTKKSESTEQPSPTTKKPPKSGAKPSRNSRAKKGEPSKGSASQSTSAEE